MIRHLLFRIFRSLKDNYDSVYDKAVRTKYNIPDSVKLGPGVILSGKVTIGEHTYINGPGFVFGSKTASVKIGKWCAIANNVTFRCETHDLKNPTGPHSRMEEEDIKIGDYVWIGANVFIKHGVTVGDYAIIGANSVVTKDVAPHTIVAGVPAKLLRTNEREDQAKPHAS